ncbi:glucans biosynthesis glucosyltransferase MdoH [Labedella populi]|uniref:Glucans biosynthesis glucosyltransferase H n=1 Tax=Labedella populi TaxID=2498850 RepID=A0A444QCE4_9MICO|nr:glucans biosynthesis glucosyltransferase MdoH [Labedella populi]RWZ64369.1 glucans biosynthesis glucosyltransferase MdoH [Labedella populi]
MSGRHATTAIAFQHPDAPSGAARAIVLTGTAITTLAGTSGAWWALVPGGLNAAEFAQLMLFGVCFAWIAFAFWTAVVGYRRLVAHGPVSGLRGPVGAADTQAITSRVALVVPMRNEDPHAVFANIRAIGESIGRSRHPELIDFFILSDTVDPDIQVAEEIAWTELRGHLASVCQVFYRRRTDNTGKKAGNLAEFCRRWGAGYEYFIVLDADSLMEADTIIMMTRIMELNRGVGILQAPPTSIDGSTRFARLQQFAGFAYGTVVTAGMSAWQRGDSNYWGHNAIIRTAAFARYCGLPVLSGTGPFSGEILSHDFVEAALMRRAGYEVWMLPELAGSYERLPPTLLDYAQRDRRWAAGNLQHLRLLTTAGLHPLSRLHLFMGAASYLMSPVWLLFILAGVVSALIDSTSAGHRAVDPLAAIIVFAASSALVFAPRALGIIVILRDRDTRRALGGGGAVLLSGLVEIVVSAAMAPVTMVMQTTSLVGILSGATVTWGVQRRDGGRPSRIALLRVHAPHVVLGLALLATALLVPGSAFWLAAMIASLLAAPLLTAWSSGTDAPSSLLGRLVRVPEEVAPPRVVTRADELAGAQAPLVVDGLRRVLTDGRAHSVHLAVLETAATRPAPVPERVARLVREGAWASIDPRDRALALASPDFLATYRRLPVRLDRASHGTPAPVHH